MRRSKRFARTLGIGLAAAVALLVGVNGVQAGAIFFAGKLHNGELVPAEKTAKPCFTVRYSSITATIENQQAHTRTEETIAGPTEGEVSAVCLIPLPRGTDPKSPAVTVVRADKTRARLEAQFLPAAEAQKLYEAIAKGTGSVAVLTFSGRPALLIPEFRLPPKLEVVVEYRQRLKDTDGLFAFECPMPQARFAREPVGRVSLTATVRQTGKRPLRAIFSPTHAAAIERKGLYEAVARLSVDDWADGGSFRLLYVADADPLGLRVLAHRSEDDEGGFFLLVGNPTGSAKPEKPIEKDVLFVLDTSGSMRGEKIEQARAAIDYCLEHLNPGDRFNIVTFGTAVKSFREGLVARSPGTLRAAQAFADEVVAAGRTNISGALAKGLAGEPTPGRPRIMIFLTDGTPTAGELVPDNIIKKLAEMNASGTRVFVMGVGHDVNAHLLDRIAEDTDGSSEYVEPQEEIDVKVAGLYNRLSNPVLTDVKVAFGELRTHSVFPRKLPALFKGSEIMIAGRYRNGGTHTVAISGTLNGQPRRYACTAKFPEKVEAAHGFVASIWAARKIGYLLQEIRLHGENQELVEEVVRLSRKFGIVTEYTAFIAMADGEMSEEAAAKTAVRHMREANAQKAGQWAFNQARNDAALQQRVFAAPGANTYRDRRGRVRTVEGVRQVGRRAFYLRKGRWVDADDAGKRKSRTVKLFSKEYFELLRKSKDFAKAQAVGWNVTINVGDERIVVEK